MNSLEWNYVISLILCPRKQLLPMKIINLPKKELQKRLKKLKSNKIKNPVVIQLKLKLINLKTMKSLPKLNHKY